MNPAIVPRRVQGATSPGAAMFDAQFDQNAWFKRGGYQGLAFRLCRLQASDEVSPVHRSTQQQTSLDHRGMSVLCQQGKPPQMCALSQKRGDGGRIPSRGLGGLLTVVFELINLLGHLIFI